MGKIDLLESLKKFLPSDSVNEVTSAVDTLLAEAKEEIRVQLDAEATSKLEEAYSELSQELADAEKTAVEGYQEAYNVINDLRNRLDIQREEFEKQLIEGYEEAYGVIKAEQAKNGTLEVDLHDEYTAKFNEVRSFMVEKLDEFLQEKGQEIYEQAKRDILSDPRYAEHKVALDKIVEVTANYLSDEEQTFATSARLEEASRHIEDLQAQVKLMEARQIRVEGENRKLHESVRTKEQQLTEATQTDRKERTKKAKNVSGRGFIDSNKTVVLAEYDERRQARSAEYEDDDDDDDDADNDQLFEGYEGCDLNQMNKLAGTKETKRSRKTKK